jgi:hypothetical protein
MRNRPGPTPLTVQCFNPYFDAPDFNGSISGRAFPFPFLFSGLPAKTGSLCIRGGDVHFRSDISVMTRGNSFTRRGAALSGTPEANRAGTVISRTGSGFTTCGQRLIGLVKEPGWFFHKSHRFGVLFAKIRQICRFLAEVVQ